MGMVTPAALRIKLLREEYTHLIANPALLFDKLDCLVALHSTERIEAWKTLARQEKWDEFVAQMLEQHYAPAYSRSMFRNFVAAEGAKPLPVDVIDTEGFSRIAATLPA